MDNTSSGSAECTEIANSLGFHEDKKIKQPLPIGIGDFRKIREGGY